VVLPYGTVQDALHVLKQQQQQQEPGNSSAATSTSNRHASMTSMTTTTAATCTTTNFAFCQDHYASIPQVQAAMTALHETCGFAFHAHAGSKWSSQATMKLPWLKG
jgi:hypothetical protein